MTGARACPGPPGRRPPRPVPGCGRVSGGWRGAAAAGLAALLLSACATVPDSGPWQAGKVALAVGGQGQDYLQLIPAPPRPGWSPKQVVLGFLTACASFANNHAVARQYLDPAVRKTWDPGWAVTVVARTRLRPSHNVPAHQAGSPSQVEEVTATGEKLASLTGTGQYVGTQGGSTSTSYTFQLFRSGGQWRIENPPKRLLLTEPDFKSVYAPRNLYYLAPRARALVPDPVFVPLQATSVDLAGKLVTALQHRPRGWLENAVSTAFPVNTRLLRVTINGGAATVDLGGKAAGASATTLSSMASQLAWTLAGPSGGQFAIQSVGLEINGHLRRTVTLSGGQPGRPWLSLPPSPARAPLYSLSASGAIQEAPVPGADAHIVPGAAGPGRARLTVIAVSPRRQDVAGFTRSRKVVYHGSLLRAGRLARWPVPGGRVNSLSWDVSGNLWVATSDATWMLPPRGPQAPLGTGLPPGSVSQLRVAPDGVRVAMIVRNPRWRRPQLLVAAIGHAPGGGLTLGPTVPIGTDVSDPTQLTWYDADDLIVLSGSPTAPQLQEVPVNGGSSVQLLTEPGTQSVTAAGPANPVAAGLAGGRLALTTSLNGTWTTQKRLARSPAYPG